MADRIRNIRDGVFCALAFLACFWVAWPVAQMGFADGWSFIKSAQAFARTGHFVYNGWAAEMLGWMIPWGALFIKLFGFSYMTVKLSTLPLAVATLLLFHAVLIRFEISRRNAVIGTLTLGLSPLFLPLSASFMSDIPGLFVIVLCLYCCQRAVAAGSERAAIAWLVVAAASNIVGGTARQVAWLGVLVIVPCTGWLLRERRRVLVTAAVLWVAGIGSVLYCMHWFARQPYSVPVPIFPTVPHSIRAILVNSLLTTDLVGALAVCLLLLTFPVLVAWLPQFGKKFDHYLALFSAGLLPMLAMKFLLGPFAEIWPPHIIYKELATKKDVTSSWITDGRHSLIPVPAQIVISLFFIAAALGMIFAIQSKGWRSIWSSHPRQAREGFWLLFPVTASYLTLVLTLVWHGLSADRYLLGVLPFVVAGCIWLYQRCIGPELPRISVLVLALYAVFAVTGTHDWFAWQRARLSAIHELRAAGIPRREIEGGFEYDGWTQLSNGGHVNNSLIKIPRNAYQSTLGRADRNNECAFHNDIYLDHYPKIDPRYAVGFEPSRCYPPSRFPAVHYTAWLPPFRRTVEVEKVPGR